MDFLLILIPIWMVMGALGAWVAMAKFLFRTFEGE